MTDDPALTQLVNRCQQGDLEAFALLFRRFRQYVYDLACVILRDNVAAQDAVQDTFLRVMEKIDTFAKDAAFETWLTAVTVNICRSHLRRQKVRRFLSLEDLRPAQLLHISGAAANTARLVEERLFRQSLWQMVNTLPDRLRLPLILRYRYALPCADIADVLGVKLGTVYQQLNEGRRQLEKLAAPQETARTERRPESQAEVAVNISLAPGES